MSTTVKVQIQQRIDTAANWASANPTPLSGEICWNSDDKKYKIGDGSTAWASLSYAPGSGGYTAGTGVAISASNVITSPLQTGAEIKTAYEAESNTNAFTDTEKTKLSGIATSANNYVISSDLLDEDNMATNSATKVPSQQSVKAYVDANSSDTTYTAGTGLQLSGTQFSVTSLAISTVQEASSESAQLSLTTQEGDIVVRTDENKSYVKNSGNAGSMADFTLLRTPTDAVLSVNGNTGAITAAQIATAVESASDSNTFTDADHTKLNGIEASANNYSISSDLLDEDNFASDSATKAASQQSIKAYISTQTGGNSFTAVANGSIANNKPIKLDSDGKVSEIKVSLTAITGQPPNYTQTITDNTETEIVRNSWNANANKMLLLHKYSSGTLGAKVATISTSVSEGSFSAGSSQTACSSPGDDAAIGYDPNTYQHLFVYNDTSKSNNKLCARLGTISGTSITYGTQVDLYTANTNGSNPSIVYDDSNDKFIVVYRNSSNKLTAVVGTVSGTDISFSSPVSNTDTHTLYDGNKGLVAAFDTDQNKVLAVFPDSNLSSGRLGYCVGSINSGSITWGTVAQLSSTTADFVVMAFGATNNKFMISFRGTSDNNYGRVMSVKIDSGATTVTAGSEFYLRSAETTSGRNIKGKSIAWDSASNIFAIYATNTNHSNERNFITYATDASGTGSGQPITQQGANAFENVDYSDSHQKLDIASMGSHGRFVAVGMRTSDGKPRYTLWNAVESASNLTQASNFVGFADQAYTNGQTAKILTYGSIVTSLSGLTIGSVYYVQGDGTLNTSYDNVNLSSLDSNTPVAGTALSTSNLLIRDPLIKT